MKIEIREHIRSKLEALAEAHNIHIIHAIESGSRAWGFPSKDSDYDVRFIYVHPVDYYLSVDRKRDVIETPIAFDPVLGVDFDMNGWDLKKALYLGLRGNAVVNEWLTSPLQYMCNPQDHQDLRDFIRDTADLRAYFHFYRNYMRTPWNSYAADSGARIKIKHYCYVLRCALSLDWLETVGTPPPMDVPTLLRGITIGDDLRGEIDRLIARKADSVESDAMARVAVLDDYIDGAINQDRERPEKNELEARHIDTANAVFRRLVCRADTGVDLRGSALKKCRD